MKLSIITPYYNCLNYPVIIARERNTKNIVDSMNKTENDSASMIQRAFLSALARTKSLSCPGSTFPETYWLKSDLFNLTLYKVQYGSANFSKSTCRRLFTNIYSLSRFDVFEDFITSPPILPIFIIPRFESKFNIFLKKLKKLNFYYWHLK